MTGFHEGELAVQARAGVREQAARRGRGMLAAPDLNGSIGAFLAARQFAVVSARDDDGRLWTSPLHAEPGFLDGRDRTLRVAARPAPGDPLHSLTAGRPVGMLAIDFANRRRVRVNGTVSDADSGALVIDVDQAYGNCPRFIQPRDLSPAPPSAAPDFTRAATLDAEQAAVIAAADTLFLGTAHPTRGADASHRGGPPGFIDVTANTLSWPDYPGNNMFNSLGNLAVDPAAAVLVVDFTTGTTVQVSGTGAIEWSGTDRRVALTVEAVVGSHRPDLRAVQ